jgi:alginate O-acetyltransferase complex protein AlgJ
MTKPAMANPATPSNATSTLADSRSPDPTGSTALDASPAAATVQNHRIFATSAALTLVAVMLLGVWQVAAAVRTGLEYPNSLLDFREGRMTAAIEKQIDHKLPAREGMIAVANSLRYKLVHGGGDQVRLGRDDWLFLTDEIRYYPNADANLTARVDLLGQTQARLAEQGITLIVALVPDKARMYPQYLADGSLPAYTQTRYAQALAGLRAKGVIAIDLIAYLSYQSIRNGLVGGVAGGTVDGAAGFNYYRTDTHWNMVGAQAAARAVAATVKSTLQAKNASLETVTFATQASGPALQRAGDLIKLMGLSSVSNFWRPRPDNEAPQATEETGGSGSGGAAGGLLGDAAAPPVTLLGTSYSLRGNFHGHLQQALSVKVLNTAKDGGGFLQAATEYFKDDAFKISKPQVIVWELPERFLSAPLEQEATWLASVGLVR